MSKLRTQLDKTVDLLVEQLEKKYFAQQMPKVKRIVLVKMKLVYKISDKSFSSSSSMFSYQLVVTMGLQMNQYFVDMVVK